MASTPNFYKKIRLLTRENLGGGEISLPEEEMETTACWIALPQEAADKYETAAANGLAGLIRNAAPAWRREFTNSAANCWKPAAARWTPAAARRAAPPVSERPPPDRAQRRT